MDCHTCKHVCILTSTYTCTVPCSKYTYWFGLAFHRQPKICSSEPHISVGEGCFRANQNSSFSLKCLSSSKGLHSFGWLKFRSQMAKSFARNSNLIDSHQEKCTCLHVSRLPCHVFGQYTTPTSTSVTREQQVMMLCKLAALS